MATALIGLGSNLGDRAAALEKALELLREESQIRVEAVSSFRESKPAGGPEQGEFLNAAARLETSLSPEELLANLLAIEDQIGRVRVERWGPRLIDLDLLLYDRVEMKTPTLELPHPRMCYRRFVLEPAADVAPRMFHPGCGATVRSMLKHLKERPRYVALGGLNIWGRKETLAALERHPNVIPIRVEFPRDSFRSDPGKTEQVMCELLANETDVLTKLAVLNFYHQPLNAISEAPSEKWCVSDYWFEQLLADFAFYSEKQILGTLYPFSIAPVLPRLLILDDFVEVAETNAEGLVRYNKYMRGYITDYKIAVLRLDAESDTVSEVLAAMQAME